MKDRMRPYLAIFRQKLMSGLQYRAGFWGTTTTHVVWVYMRVVLVSIFYRYGSGQAGVTLSQAATMIWLQEMALNLMPGFTADNTAWEKISKGDVGYDLVRPLDVYNHWYVSAFSDKLARFLLAIGPVALVGIPGEPFTAIGVGIKEAEGWKCILPMCLTNGCEGYFPMKDAFDEGGYEARSSVFRGGVGEAIIDGGISLLNELREGRQ